eukprot:snap_masked-scaffold30_size591359-processed-gene-2.10 protein:Tk12757 transcript:snap_masked-scaffold30_size591359-processed-gene-2.10-mRNA-1 annotation:"chloride channel protein 2 isoform x2"
MANHSLGIPKTLGGSNYESDEEGDGPSEMGYQQTLMYGRYSKTLGEYAKEQAKLQGKRQRFEDKRRKKDSDKRVRELTGSKKRGSCYSGVAQVVTWFWKHTFAKIGEDWVFLAALGIIMACVSFLMDYGIATCNRSRLWLYRYLGDHLLLQFVAWTGLPVFLILFAAGFVNVMSPQAIGSGIPEMKTILRGVVLKEYLSGKTLIAKAVGLTATLGSGMPLGKEGPFVHIASIVATSLSKLVTSFQGIYANESRNSEMLAAACAVGVACCFGSPIGGVLFSIEVTSVYFAVRNYWRGFFSAVCGAMAFRLIAIWFDEEETIVAVFPTGFDPSFPYDPQELFVFAVIGVICGLGGSLYVYLHRRYVLWMRGNKRLTKFLQKNRFIYPFFIAFLITAVTFPPFLGQFQASDISTHDQIHVLFSNYTWSQDPADMSVDEWDHVKHWITPYTGIFVNLVIFILMTFFLSILAATLPVPTGVLIPAFKVGAAFGRLMGEAMHVWFPEGVRYGGVVSNIVPGGYATVGAAAFSGAVTHTISISVIVFEMTGQITHCVPVLIAVLIANAIASLLQPSCYDSIIMIKKLPYLPDILPSGSNAYNLTVDDFMLRKIQYIWYGMNYKELRALLKLNRKLKGFPLVDKPDSMILVGSVQRTELIASIEGNIAKDKRMKVAALRYGDQLKKWRSSALKRKDDEHRRAQVKLDEEVNKRSQNKFPEDVSEDLTAMPSGSSSGGGEKPKPQRRPSRFEVTTEAGSVFVPDSEEAEDKETISPVKAFGSNLDPDSPAMRALQQLSAKPKKSILKKNNSYTIHAFGIPGLETQPDRERNSTLPNQRKNGFDYSEADAPYLTVTGAENRLKKSLGNIQNLFKRPSQLNLLGSRPELRASSFSGRTPSYMMDMSLEEQKEWEEAEMLNPVNFKEVHIDAAPFQLVEKTSLLKVHSLFSMLGVNHAYVTALGKLIGVVGLKELRQAIEGANSGQAAAAKSVEKEPKASPEKNADSVESAAAFKDIDEASDDELLKK